MELKQGKLKINIGKKPNNQSFQYTGKDKIIIDRLTEKYNIKTEPTHFRSFSVKRNEAVPVNKLIRFRKDISKILASKINANKESRSL